MNNVVELVNPIVQKNKPIKEKNDDDMEDKNNSSLLWISLLIGVIAIAIIYYTKTKKFKIR